VTESEEDADGFSIGSEETLKPQLKVMDLNGSVGSLISEVGVGVLKREKSKGKERGRERDREKEREHENERLSMSLYTPGSSPSSQSVGARIIRNVTAGRQKLLPNGNGHGLHLLSSSPSSSDLGSPTPSTASLSTLSYKSHLATKERADDEGIPHEMTASAPSILHSISSSSSAKSSSVSVSSHGGVGSKSTKIMHHPPRTPSGIKVKAR
jgi:ubiquitin carboxyl-terminal hydrolase 1